MTTEAEAIRALVYECPFDQFDAAYDAAIRLAEAQGAAGACGCYRGDHGRCAHEPRCLHDRELTAAQAAVRKLTGGAHDGD